MTVISMPTIFRAMLIAILAIVTGAFVGWCVWPAVTGQAIAILGGRYRGFAGILFQFCACVGAALGGSTAFVFVASGSRWRQVAGWAISLAVVAALAWIGPHAWDFLRSDGRRLALAVYGVPMLWACVLGALGCRMALRPGRQAPPRRSTRRAPHRRSRVSGKDVGPTAG